MIKLNLTKSIIKFIKSKKEEYNIKSNVLADKLGKSSAYISKLEKGDFKTIELNDFYNIIAKIIDDENESVNLVNNFLCDYIKNLKSYNVYYEDEGIRTFDETIIEYNINKELIDYILQFIKERNITIQEIANQCNRNDDLSPEEKSVDYSFNEYNKSESSIFIMFHTEYKIIEDILSGKKNSCRYIELLMIVYSILRLSKKPKFSPNGAEMFARNILTTYNFKSLFEQNKSSLADKKIKEELPKLDSMPLDAKFSLARIINFMDFVTTKDLVYSIKKLNSLEKNLIEEPSFLMALLETDITPIKEISIDKKRELLEKISDMVNTYAKQSNDNEIELL